MDELKRKLGIESRTMHNTSKIDEPKAKRLKMLSYAKRRKAREDAARTQNNQYCNGYDFELFSKSSRVYPYLIRGGLYTTIDWKNHEAVKAFNLSLLKRDFNISIDLASGRLVPSVPSRLNYIKWINDLLAISKKVKVTSCHFLENKIDGIDIGTGSSCVYPLLGTSMHKKWHFYATEMDSISLECARKNVLRNPDYKQRIKLIQGSGRNLFKPVFEEYSYLGSKNPVAFTMCNPPYYKSKKEWNLNRQDAFGGHPVEMVTEGGEASFVRKMVEESVIYKDKVVWFTTLLGFKHHLKSIKALLESLSHQHAVTAVKHTTFKQGRTCRWGIAWSFFEGLNEHEAVEVKFKISNRANLNGQAVKDVKKYVHDRIAVFVTSNCCKDYRMKHKVIGGNCIVEISPSNGRGMFNVNVDVDSDSQVSFVLVPMASQNLAPSMDLKAKGSNYKFDFFKIVDNMRSCISQSRRWKRRKLKASKEELLN